MTVVATGLGCGSGREAAWEQPAVAASTGGEENPGAQSRREQLIERGEAAWAKRLEEPQLRAAVGAWEQAVALMPGDHETWVRLARAYYFLGDGHLRLDKARRDEMVSTYEKGIQAAERALLALSPEFAERMRTGTRIEEAIQVLDAKAVPALYWRSSNMGRWGLAKGFTTVLSYKDEIRAIMARCLQLDPNYFHVGPHRYFGAFYARVPAFAGGDLDRSREHFETAIRGAPYYLGSKTLMAEFYAVKRQDRALFDRLLQEVLDGTVDENAEADVSAENTIERQRAKALRERGDELFE